LKGSGQLCRRQCTVVRFPGRNRVPACFQAEAVSGGAGDPSTDRGALGRRGALDVFGSGGLWWTVYPMHGIQKVRGSNPLGSTKFCGFEQAKVTAKRQIASMMILELSHRSVPLVPD